MKYLSLFFFLGASAAHAQPQFEIGNHIQILEWRGEVTVSCRNDDGSYPRRITHHCYDYQFEPSASSYFVAPNVDAYWVELSSLREDGSQAKKLKRFDSQNGRSKERINLMISTLLQKPLLKIGYNQVSYRFLTKKKESISEGQLQIRVEAGPTRLCPHRYQDAWGADCSSNLSQCRSYFNQVEPYCR